MKIFPTREKEKTKTNTKKKLVKQIAIEISVIQINFYHLYNGHLFHQSRNIARRKKNIVCTPQNANQLRINGGSLHQHESKYQKTAKLLNYKERNRKNKDINLHGV